MSKYDDYYMFFTEEQIKYLWGSNRGIDRMKALECIMNAAATEPTKYEKKGFATVLDTGQAALSEVELASCLGCDRKTVSRMLERMSRLGLVTSDKSNRTTVHTVHCLACWLFGDKVIRNPHCPNANEVCGDDLPLNKVDEEKVYVTSIHTKTCKIFESEAHNRRTKEYMSHINKKDIRLREDLTCLNEEWISPDIAGMSLLDYQGKLAVLVKQKTGRCMQMKEHERRNSRTGVIKKVPGCCPIREGVVVCSPTTTMDDLRRFAQRFQERWGIRTLQIFLHKDEGHYGYDEDSDTMVWKPNLHAHFVFDWVDHSTGKIYHLQREDFSEMQTLLADTLGMERGRSKEETKKWHLEREDYIIATQKKEAREAERRKAEAEAARDAAVKAAAEVKREKALLDAEVVTLKKSISRLKLSKKRMQEEVRC